MCSMWLLVGCNKGSDSGSSTNQIVDTNLLENFASNVVIPTYQDLAARATDLKTAIAALQATPTQDTLNKARDAWKATRRPWEQSEALLYGPVETYGHDGAVDSWPLNKTDLNAVMDSNQTIDEGFVSSLQENQKGFHTIEYLIYGETSDKAPTAFKAREFEYMTAATANLVTIANNLALSWSDGVEGKPAYKTTFVTAGQSGNTVYPSFSAAGEEIVQGMIGICNEVAESKIATPFDAQDANLVESQFSYNSLLDFADNIRSVENAYKGAYSGATATPGASLSERVAAVDAALDTKIKDQITAAIAAILAIPEPFPISMKDPANGDKIRNAQATIRTLRETLTSGLLPLVKQ